MSPRRQAGELTPEQVRIAVAMRELRRGAAAQAFRERLYGAGPVVLDIGQQDALDVVASLGEARMGDVAVALRVDPSTATRAVAKLEASGFVERRRSSQDARSVVVAVTAEGARLQAAIGAVARSALAELFARFDADEQQVLADLLERLVDGLDDVASLPDPLVSE